MGTLTNLSKTQLSQEQNSYTSFCFLSHEVKWPKTRLQHLGLNISAIIMCIYLSVTGHQQTEIWDIKDDFLKNVLLAT